MKSLYRRYRPVRLEEVVGQEQVVKPLLNSLKAGKVGHAYLFVGPRGCGKTSVARILAHEMNGFQYEIEDDYVDIIEIDGASNRGIDNIRELREKVLIAPSEGKYKIYIIDEVHMLTKEAFNALLKTLEEPPAHAVFIMATTDAYKVPVTITSRAQCYTFKLADTKTMFDYLKTVCEKEKIPIEDEALSLIVKRGGGSFRDSLSLLDQISSLSKEKITKEMVVMAMGLPEDEKICELLEQYSAGDLTNTATCLKELLASGVKAETIAEEMIRMIVDAPKAELMALLAKLPEVKAPYAEAKILVALMSSGMVPAAGRVQVQPLAQMPSQSPSQPVRRPTPKSSPQPAAQPSPRPAPAQASTETSRVQVDASKVSSGDTSSEPTTAPEPTNTVNIGQFDWESFLNKVQGMNDAVYSQLAKCSYTFANGELKIYPPKRIMQTIISRDNNKRILIDAGGGVKITICEAGTTPEGAAKDETLAKISAIMGGEVRNDGGGNPFE